MELELRASQINSDTRNEQVVELDIESIRTPIRQTASRTVLERPLTIAEEPEIEYKYGVVGEGQVKEEETKSQVSPMLRGGTSEERLTAAGLLNPIRGREMTIGRSQSEEVPPANQQILQQQAATIRSASRTSEAPSQLLSPQVKIDAKPINVRGMTPYLQIRDPETARQQLRDVHRSISPIREDLYRTYRDNLSKLIAKAEEEQLRVKAIPEQAAAFAKLSIKPMQPEAYTGKSSRLEDLETIVSRMTMWFWVTGMLCSPLTIQMVSLVAMWLKDNAHEWYNQMYVLGDAQMEEVTPRMIFEGLRERFM